MTASVSRRPGAIVLTVGLLGLAWGAVRAQVGARSAATPPDALRRTSMEIVQAYLRVSAEVQASGGDPRFVERLPAAPRLAEELLAQVAFARHAGVVESPRLVRVEFLGSKAVGPDRVEVEAREYWVTTTIPKQGSPEVRSDVVLARYLVGRDAASWQVLGWESIEPGEAAYR